MGVSKFLIRNLDSFSDFRIRTRRESVKRKKVSSFEPSQNCV